LVDSRNVATAFMPDTEDLAWLSSYLTACKTLSEALFADMPEDR